MDWPGCQYKYDRYKCSHLLTEDNKFPLESKISEALGWLKKSKDSVDVVMMHINQYTDTFENHGTRSVKVQFLFLISIKLTYT